jgi:hypothetical protein
MPIAGRPAPRMRSGASCWARWRSATPTTPARWRLLRSWPRLTAWARSSTSWCGGDALPAQPAAAQPPGRRARALFTFLRLPGVQATNWRAEQAIRPAVVTRKSWGGNRTWAGAELWQVLTSLLRTATQQARDPVELLGRLLQAPTPTVADLAIPAR